MFYFFAYVLKNFPLISVICDFCFAQMFFWTGSPNLPASESGFNQLPSLTIRPPDDIHFPTANTCISRLYLPAYSTKAIMKSRLLVAIKAKNFGFV